MRMRLSARRRAAVIDTGFGPVEFEFAHLLDAMSHVTVSHVGVDVGPRVAANLVPDVEPDVVADLEPDLVPDVVPDVVVSRFADCGLDDDRLPVAVKRRSGRRP